MDPLDPLDPSEPTLVQFKMAGPMALVHAMMLLMALTSPSDPVHYSENWLRYSGRTPRRCARVHPFIAELDFFEFHHNRTAADDAYDGDGA